jgi:DNA-binding transcriptional ArsR family regulator
MKLLKSHPPKLNSREEHLVNAMQVLGDKTRFKIFKILLSGKEMCVTEIAEALDISVPAVSQHFRIFELVGLVGKTRYGQKICYSLKSDDPFVRNLVQIVE